MIYNLEKLKSDTKKRRMSNHVNNPELRNNLELLAKKAFTLYNNLLKHNGQSPTTADTFQISIMINGLAYDINRFEARFKSSKNELDSVSEKSGQRTPCLVW